MVYFGGNYYVIIQLFVDQHVHMYVYCSEKDTTAIAGIVVA